MAIAIPTRKIWTRQPQYSSPIDLGNPAMKNLALAWSATRPIVDQSGNNIITQYGTSFSRIIVPSGIAINSTGDNSTDRYDLGPIPASDPLNGQKGITVIALVSINSGALNNIAPRIIDKSNGGGGSGGWYLGLDSSNHLAFQVNGSASAVLSSSVLPTATPIIVAASCTQSGSVLQYLNGTPLATTGTTSAIPSTTTNASLLNWPWSTDRQWNGWAQIVLAFGAVLDPKLIASLSANIWQSFRP